MSQHPLLRGWLLLVAALLAACSAPDGQFVAFICQDVRQNATMHLLDMRTAAVRQIAQGVAAAFAWSPTGHNLLVAQQADESIWPVTKS